jgi:hypothetical protein
VVYWPETRLARLADSLISRLHNFGSALFHESLQVFLIASKPFSARVRSAIPI